MPNSLDSLVSREVSLLALSMPQIVFPEAFKEQCILLIHQEPLTMALVLLQHSHVSCASLCVLQPSHAIIVTCLEFADVLRILCGHLTKALWSHIPELTSINCNAISIKVDALSCCLPVYPHPVVHFTAKDVLFLAHSVRLVIGEHARIHFAIDEGKLSETFFPIVHPLSFVLLSISFHLTAITVLFSIRQFTFVEAATLLKDLLIVLVFNGLTLHL